MCPIAENLNGDLNSGQKSLVTQWKLVIGGPIIDIYGLIDHSVTGLFVYYSGHQLVTRLVRVL